jgi:5-methylcytosine-specific restriction endonuclease McrA
VRTKTEPAYRRAELSTADPFVRGLIALAYPEANPKTVTLSTANGFTPDERWSGKRCVMIDPVAMATIELTDQMQRRELPLDVIIVRQIQERGGLVTWDLLVNPRSLYCARLSYIFDVRYRHERKAAQEALDERRAEMRSRPLPRVSRAAQVLMERFVQPELAQLHDELAYERRRGRRLRYFGFLMRAAQERSRVKIAAKQHEIERLQALANEAVVTEEANRALVKSFRRDLPITRECPYCTKALSPDDAHLDHIVPVSQGGLATPLNLVMVCSSCNLRKHELTLLEFTEKYALDFADIVARLRSLGKRI